MLWICGVKHLTTADSAIIAYIICRQGWRHFSVISPLPCVCYRSEFLLSTYQLLCCCYSKVYLICSLKVNGGQS
ncbi:Os03g0195400 [Oryza sativa Japonica Group]|uniref:Os03g0195400 protein n=1 Tax=Oryza sativa subsp. japonica TaxID=39947 RepID=A0A0P0VUA4_ORYSJ|nr:hypothetical protein EE612_015864 [Oryza sativa]BAS82760.1 Os03g0195400 [Oryza sativa Japonica Group]